MSSDSVRSAKPSLADRYRVLLEIGRTLTGTLTHEELYRTLYHEIRRVLEADGFYISLYDAQRDEATIVFFADRNEVRLSEIVYRGSDSPVLRRGESVLVRDGLETRSVLVLGDDATHLTRSGISAPLRLKGRTLGAVSVQSYLPDAFGEVDLELLEGIADLAAVALDNARHVAELDRKRREAEQMEQIGRALASSLDPQQVLERVIDAVLDLIEDAQGASVWLLEPGRVARVAASGGYSAPPVGLETTLRGSPFADLADQARPVTLDDLRAGPVLPEALMEYIAGGSGVAVPLAIGDEVVGILFCDSPDNRPMGGDEERILRRLASQASVALGNARLHASVQSLSLTDPLTLLANRRHLRMHLEREVAAARRGRPLHAVLLDIDQFKQFNDTHGHLAGDRALRAFADVLRAENRAMNLVARFGGDEFVSILTDSTDEGVRQYLERLLERVRENPVLAAGGIEITWGICAFDPAVMKTPDDLIEAADADFYHRKERRTRGITD